jgi:hypothetical protein
MEWITGLRIPVSPDRVTSFPSWGNRMNIGEALERSIGSIDDLQFTAEKIPAVLKSVEAVRDRNYGNSAPC